MAVLGLQLVFSMVTASLLSKVSPRMSFARWLLCSKLVRYLHPTEEELKMVAGVPKSETNKKGKRNDPKQQKQKENITIPRNTNVQLEAAQIGSVDVIPLKFYTEYQWLIDFALCALLIYTVTEIYYAVLQPQEEFNLSMVWCLVVLGFALKIMYSLTAIYFHTEDGGERILCIMFGFFFLIFAMGILVVDENTLEFGLEKAYQNFSKQSQTFLDSQGMESAGPASLLTFRIILAILCAIMGAFMTFPGLRLAKMHHDALLYARESPIKQAILHLNMIFPMFVSLMWVKPVMRQYLVKKEFGGRRIIMDDETFDVIRVVVILVFCLFRFALLWTHLQSHLNTAVDKMTALRKEAGRIGVKELQQMVTSIYYYLCVVALQYLTPLIMLVFSALMMKTLGDYSWSSVSGFELPSLNRTISSNRMEKSDNVAADVEQTVTETAAQITLALSTLRQVFTPLCFRAIFSFLCWWISTTWFATSTFGMIYYGYFSA